MSHEPYGDYLTCMSWVVQGKVWVMREFWPVLEFEKRIKALLLRRKVTDLTPHRWIVNSS
jgi:hypothetical protein